MDPPGSVPHPPSPPHLHPRHSLPAPLPPPSPSTVPFSLPTHISLYISPRALFIKPARLHSPPKALVRLEWSSFDPNLALVQDALTIQDELSIAAPVKLEFDGLVGSIKLFHDCYLLLISSHTTPATFAGKNKVHRIERVLALPLEYTRALDVLTEESKRRRASVVPASARSRGDSCRSRGDSCSQSELSEGVVDEGDRDVLPEADDDPPLPASVPQDLSLPKPDGAKINFTRLLWRPRPASTANISPAPHPARSPKLSDTGDTLAARLALDTKFISVLCRELCRGGMYYAYDWDITHTFQSKADLCSTADYTISGGVIEPRVSEPLHQRAHRRFWWNRLMIQPFIQSGFDSLGFVIMQGFVESKSVPISPAPTSKDESEDADQPKSEPDTIEMGLLSRRAVTRPGLRYQRRGVDIHGAVANAVETECILEHDPWPGSKAEKGSFWSFVQVRGSVPLFWGQSPWALRPPIVLEGTDLENLEAMKKHFSDYTKLYGDVLIICLAEKTGNEGKLVHEYESKVNMLNQSSAEGTTVGGKLKFVGWDFHVECKGMRYENVVKLVDLVREDLDEIGYFSSTDVGRRQTGVIRSNCIDCLDRTNVIQSAIARQLVQRFMSHLLQGKARTERTEQGWDVAFNVLWANNGDQISKQYAGTSALKGDFVRTGKRDWRGVVNDATNSVARMWHNSISDFFKQSVLDFVLGVNVTSYAQFQESYSSASDPSALMRLSKVRSTAIDHAADHILPDSETKLAGWCLLLSTPASEPNQPSAAIAAGLPAASAALVAGLPAALGAGLSGAACFEERVLVLSNKALYVVSYEYVLQKVQEFLRIGLEDIISIQMGAYITAVTEDRDRDVLENYGFLVSYDEMAGVSKTNTYTMSLERSGASVMNVPEKDTSSRSDEEKRVKVVAFKALKNLSSIAGGESDGRVQTSAERFVKLVVERIHKECVHTDVKVIEETIVGVEEAERQAGLLARMTRGVKQIMIG